MDKLSPTQQAVIDGARDDADGSIYPLPANLKGGAAQKVVAALKAKGLIDDNGILTTRSRTTTALDDAEPATPTITALAIAEPVVAEADEAATECDTGGQEAELATDEEGDDETGIAEDVEQAEEAIAQPTALANDDEPATPFMAIQVMGLHFGLESDQFKSIVDECLEIAFRQGFASAKPGKKAKPERQTTPKKAVTHRADTKQAKVIAMLRRLEGATVDQIMTETGWQIHTARGFISLLKTKHGIETRREGKTYFAAAA